MDRQALLAFLASRLRPDAPAGRLGPRRPTLTKDALVDRVRVGEERANDELDLIEADLARARQSQQRRTRMTEDAVASVVGSGVPSV